MEVGSEGSVPFGIASVMRIGIEHFDVLSTSSEVYAT